MGINLGSTYLLENGAESHALIFGDQLASMVAENMQEIEFKPERFFVHTQNDTATHNNVENVRNIFLDGLKDKLGVKKDQIAWKNDFDVEFRFDELEFLLSQEGMHLNHRLAQLRAFKYAHPDSGYMQKDMKYIIRNLRLQYDSIESPFILNTATKDHKAYYTPYDLMEKCEYERSIFGREEYDFVLSRFVRALWMLRGTKKKKYRNELKKFMYRKKYNQSLTVDDIRNEFKKLIYHSPPYLLSSIFSVEYVYISRCVLCIYIFVPLCGHIDLLGWS